MRGVQASLDRVLSSLHAGAARPNADAATTKPSVQPSRLLGLLSGSGGASTARQQHRPKRQREQTPNDDDRENRPGPSGRKAEPAGACPVCGVRLPPAELKAHIDAEVAAALVDDDDDDGEGEGQDGRGRAAATSAGGAGALALPRRPPPAVPAVFGGEGGRRAQAPSPTRPPYRGGVRRPAWAATLTAVATRPGRVDHYSDARAIALAGESLGIDGVAGAAAGWEVAGASGLGAAGLNGEQV